MPGEQPGRGCTADAEFSDLLVLNMFIFCEDIIHALESLFVTRHFLAHAN
jgi:hypothetical protein